MSAFGDKANIASASQNVRYDPNGHRNGDPQSIGWTLLAF
jgi:hypothetical protein